MATTDNFSSHKNKKLNGAEACKHTKNKSKHPKGHSSLFTTPRPLLSDEEWCAAPGLLRSLQYHFLCPFHHWHPTACKQRACWRHRRAASQRVVIGTQCRLTHDVRLACTTLLHTPFGSSAGLTIMHAHPPLQSFVLAIAPHNAVALLLFTLETAAQLCKELLQLQHAFV